MKKICALYPAERKKECNHDGHLAWTGRMPMTGTLRCGMCGVEVISGFVDEKT